MDNRLLPNTFLRYLHGKITLGLRYSVGYVRLHGYIDVDSTGNVVDTKSTSGFCFILRSSMISWTRKKQMSISLSTIEAEYIVASMASCKEIWLGKSL